MCEIKTRAGQEQGDVDGKAGLGIYFYCWTGDSEKARKKAVLAGN